jgi:Uncharacterized conserved protein (COG2071)
MRPRTPHRAVQCAPSAQVFILNGVLIFLLVRIALDVKNLLIASWETDRDAVARVAPPGAEPAPVGGGYLVSIVSFRVRRGRAGPLPVPPFSQLNVRTYVTWKGEYAVLFLASRVTLGGLGGIVLGAPYRLARIRLQSGRARAPGLGLSLRYETGAPANPGELGRHELGIFETSRTHSFRIARGEAEWRSAQLVEPPGAELLLAYGFEPTGEPSLFHSATASFQARTPD